MTRRGQYGILGNQSSLHDTTFAGTWTECFGAPIAEMEEGVTVAGTQFCVQVFLYINKRVKKIFSLNILQFS